ncbi:MAG: thrombospondin type 3 repeat-containing protein [Saprospiraceae bacterium]|nr:thrombospondin type 3 repeat-containing protein [Saprospiraceae bacterium]
MFKKIFFVVLSALFILCTNDLEGQNTKYPLGISFKALFMDYQTANGGSFSQFNDYHNGFEIAVSKSLQDRLNLVIPFKIGVVNNDVFDLNKLDQGRSLHKTVYGLDAQIQYQFFNPNKEIVPYVLVGLGFVNESEGKFNMQAPLGAGLQFKAAPNAYITLQSEYRLSFTEGRTNLHHGVGFVYLFGKGAPEEKEEMEKEMEKEEELVDSDGDGVTDNLDLCPEAIGVKELNGCPDMDGDGIADYQDKCPSVAGLKVFAGCPDSDGDGIMDSEDECPNLAGTVENNGCPVTDRDNDGIPDLKDKCPDLAGPSDNDGCPQADRDKDGVPDASDACPDQAGSIKTNGCPDSDNDGIRDSEDKCPRTAGPAVYNGCPDTDGDGLHDGRDKCPNSAGPVSTNGCPEISKADRETLNIAMRAVQFDTGRSTLKSESFGVLKQIADIMRRYPDYNLMISGHTDNTGSATANQKLSERRAQACYEYLITQGISNNRLNFAGYGESRPITDNNSLRGRSLNRRVEFNLVPAN